MTKYADNAFHGVKIGFANEIGAICQALGLDSHRVMDIFLADRKLNVSPAYLRPGLRLRRLLPAQGPARPGLRGHGAPTCRCRCSRTCCPPTRTHLRRAFDLVAATGKRKVGLFGLSFKPGTDDLRESPLVELAERLIGKGYDLRIYDANVSPLPADRREPRLHREHGCPTSASC